MLYDCLMRRNAEFLFAFHLQYNDYFIFFSEIQWYIPCAKVSEIFVKARACVYIIFIDTGEDKWKFASAWQGKEEKKNEMEIILY